MWKIISLSALLFVAQAADIQDFYGDWFQVAVYSGSTHDHACLRLRSNFAKSTENVQCTYDDGRKGTLLQGTITSAIDNSTFSEKIVMRVVDTPAEVMPALNISVKCGDNVVKVNERGVARLVNEDYFIVYSNIVNLENDHTSSAVEAAEQNTAILFGRNVVSAEKLYNVMMSIEDLKNRRSQLCRAEEKHGEFKSTETEVGN